MCAERWSLLTDRDRHAETTEALRRVKAQLGTPGASGRAADAILEVASAFAKATADKTAGGAKSA